LPSVVVFDFAQLFFVCLCQKRKEKKRKEKKRKEKKRKEKKRK